MSEQATFLERALSGDVFDPDVEIDDAIEEWHGVPRAVSLAAWLGFTDLEYALFVEQPHHLGSILKARRYGIALDELAHARDEAAYALAARGLAPSDRQALVTWLAKTGRI